MKATSLIPLDTNFPEISAFIIGSMLADAINFSLPSGTANQLK